jgi:hypothetical protein
MQPCEHPGCNAVALNIALDVEGNRLAFYCKDHFGEATGEKFCSAVVPGSGTDEAAQKRNWLEVKQYARVRYGLFPEESPHAASPNR